MPLSNIQAKQIATLLNERNQLTVRSTSRSVLDHSEDYIYRTSQTGNILGCVEVKRVQWYQAEILHLTVRTDEEGNGHAKAMLAEADLAARKFNARLLQCTIREDNTASISLFLSCGFIQVSRFYNKVSGNNILILQKVLASAA